MACILNGPVLELFCNAIVKNVAKRSLLAKVWVKPSIRLDADAPVALTHTKYERPVILGIEINIGQHQQALVLLKLQVLFKVIEYLASVILLDFEVFLLAIACRHNFASFQLAKL